MRLAIQAIILCLLTFTSSAQVDRNLELVSNVTINEDASDIWGYVDAEGTEYAIMGTLRSTRVYSLEDPANPIERAVIPGATSIWRDIKSYRDHIYVTTDDFNGNAGETGDGLVIIDMSKAPDTITSSKWQPFINFQGVTGQLGECHNIYIDTVQGMAYLAGCQGVGSEGVIILDLKIDPKTPVVVGIENNRYAHDVWVQDDLMYTSDIIAGFLTMYDITDKSNAIELGRRSTTSFFTHNAWGSENNAFVFTTDERPGGKVDAYDVTDPSDIVRLDEYRPVDRFADNAIPHNTHYHDGYLVTSWYTEGLVVLDANRPDNLIKVASYDTYTDEASIPDNQADRWFYGLWGVYPYLPSGLMIGSDINTGLYVWKPSHEVEGQLVDGFTRACYLEGVVTDANSGEPIIGAEIKIMSDDANESKSAGMGVYKTGQVSEGSFMVEFSHPNYDALTLEATLESGEVTLLNAALNSTQLLINTVTADDGSPIPFVRVILENVTTGFKTTLLSNSNGVLRSAVKSGEMYRMSAARWDYRGLQTPSFLAEGAVTMDIALEAGYEDDFFADLGWTVETTAESGAWQRGIPTDQTYSGSPSQVSADILTDIGEECYATGLSGTDAGANDIDGGSTVLTSRKMDWSDYDGAKVSYHLFFANGGGQGNPPPAPDDSVYVRLSNGSETINLPGLDESTFMWTDSIISILTPADIAFTDSMVITFTAIDEGVGHIAEAQLDGFNVEEMISTATEELQGAERFSIYPNPVGHMLQVQRGEFSQGTVKYEIYSVDGRLLMQGSSDDKLIFIDTQHWESQGVYHIHMINEAGLRQIEKVIRL